MRPENFDVQKLVEDLQGTCKQLEEALPEEMELNDLTEEDHEFIDNEIFLCETCGWWCEISEQTMEGSCRDCDGDDEDEEDEDDW